MRSARAAPLFWPLLQRNPRVPDTGMTTRSDDRSRHARRRLKNDQERQCECAMHVRVEKIFCNPCVAYAI
jgi:hypothetical protein